VRHNARIGNTRQQGVGTVRIAFLGLGIMGTAMAANLHTDGRDIVVWNRSAERAAPFRDRGVPVASSARDAADRADVVISMLADDAATNAVMIDGGALDALRPDTVHLNMATVSVACAREMEQLHSERGVHYVAAPVLGRVNVAEAGNLTILAAGADGAIDRVQPLLDVLGARTWRFGTRPEQANAVKLAANFMVGCAIEAMSEASLLVEGFDVAGADFLEMMTTSIFPVPAYQGYGAAMASSTFEPAGFKFSLAAKDMRLALAAGEEASAPMPFASVLNDNYRDGLAHGDGHLDWAALSRVAARRAARG
jgi:3-hydroxyisobutyrate dehydrogenase-like beta-hydroxyacid dehydrogenase